MTESNKELARRGYEAALRGDLHAVTALLDPNVTWHGGDPWGPGACRNRQQALEFIARAAESRRIGELVDVKDAGDRVVVIMRPRTVAGGQPRLTANVTRFRDGKAVEIVHYATPEEALAAVALPQ